MTIKRALGWLVCSATLLASDAAVAHPAPFSYLDLHVGRDGVTGVLVIHIIDLAHDLHITPPERLLDPAVTASHASAMAALVGVRLAVEADGRPLVPTWGGPEVVSDQQAVRLHLKYALEGGAGRVTVAARLFPYDPAHQTFLNVYENGELRSQMILGGDRVRADYFVGTRQGVAAVVRRFLQAGVHHILIGPDHLLFLVGLLLMGGSVRRLLLVVSAFTVAHSVTLSLAALNLVAAPAGIVEPAIALSIVCVGADNLLARGGRDVRAWFAFAFGLVHGFGFASVLREMDLPERALGWSLLSFNVGVEIGQLLIVIAVAFGLTMLRSRSEVAGRRVAFAGSVVVIAVGSFWFIQRAFFTPWTS